MLRCTALGKTYRTPRGPVEAVRGIDLAVPAGRYVAIIGRSGSGKSSLMAMVGGLSRPTAGTVAVDGTDLWALGERARARFRTARIGYVFQFPSLIPTLGALDNVALPLRLAGEDGRGRAAARLAEVGLAGHAEALPGEMSAGEQRRVAIARALVRDPGLVLADEPTSDLDEETEREIMALLLGINRSRGAALVLVTHNLALAAGADAVVHVADGRTVA